MRQGWTQRVVQICPRLPRIWPREDQVFIFRGPSKKAWPNRKKNPNSLLSPLHSLSRPPNPTGDGAPASHDSGGRRSRDSRRRAFRLRPAAPPTYAPPTAFARRALSAPRQRGGPGRALSVPRRRVRPVPGGLLAPAVLPDARQGPDGGPAQAYPGFKSWVRH
uniref:Uncharacterized protein n=1 Tax=Oryza barthii TaxID=65489 RepID=A0A0D3H4X5_9ORYZ